MADAESGWQLVLLAGRVHSRDGALRTSALAERLVELGVEPRVLCTEGRSLLAARGCLALECPWLENRWLRPLAARQMCLEDNSYRPRLIHALDAESSVAASALAVLWQVPYVVTVEDYGRWRLGPAVPLESRCGAVIAGSEAMATALVRERGIPRGRVRVIPPPIEPPTGESQASREGHVPVVGTAGRWSNLAGVEAFLDAARIVLREGVDAEFVVAGEGELEVEYRRRLERLRIAEHVTFAPIPAGDECFWKVLDLYCQVSSGPSLGLYLAQALAAELPCVATEGEDSRRLLGSGRHGLLVPPEDPDALAMAIRWSLANPREARRAASIGRDWVSWELDPARSLELLWNLYQEVGREDGPLGSGER